MGNIQSCKYATKYTTSSIYKDKTMTYNIPIIKSQKDYRKFKDELQNDINQLHIHQDSEDMALLVVIGKAILNFYKFYNFKPKYEKG